MSQFFKEEGSEPPIYQKKEAVIRVVGVNAQTNQEQNMGEVKVDISEFCNNFNRLVIYELQNGILRKAQLQMSMSIVPPAK